ncbi:MAG: hypothetical protein ACQERR_01780 [Pseudomonadota bacterium]
MKTRTLLERLATLLGSDSPALWRERRAILEVLGRLRAKERKFQRQLAESSDDEEREALQGRLRVVHAQRRKGVERLLEIRRYRREKGGRSRL